MRWRVDAEDVFLKAKLQARSFATSTFFGTSAPRALINLGADPPATVTDESNWEFHTGVV